MRGADLMENFVEDLFDARSYFGVLSQDLRR